MVEVDIAVMCGAGRGKVHISARQRTCSFVLEIVKICRSFPILY